MKIIALAAANFGLSAWVRLCQDRISGYNGVMENRIANYAIVAGGALFGGILVAAATGALTPVWAFFWNGLIQHFIAMQWAQFSCF